MSRVAPYCGRNWWLMNRSGKKLQDLFNPETPFWVRPNDWIDFMLNVNAVRVFGDVEDGYGGTFSYNYTSQLTFGDPNDTLYGRHKRWFPQKEVLGVPYKGYDFFDYIRPSLFSGGGVYREGRPWAPEDRNSPAESDVEIELGSYGNYGVQAWREWPLFDTANFSYTIPYGSMSFDTSLPEETSLWRKVWYDEDVADDIPNPGWRYHIPVSCRAGTTLGWVDYPPILSVNFNPTVGPIPYLPVYEDADEGVEIVIGGAAHQPEIEDPQATGLADEYAYVDAYFNLKCPSGKVYTEQAALPKEIASLANSVDPNPLYNDNTPFNTSGDADHVGFQMTSNFTMELLSDGEIF